MRKGPSDLRQSCLDQFLQRPSRGADRVAVPTSPPIIAALSGLSLRPQRTLSTTNPTTTVSTAATAGESRREIFISSSSSSSSSTSSSRAKKRSKKSPSPKRQKEPSQVSQATSSRRRSNSAEAPQPTATSSRATSSTESYVSGTGEQAGDTTPAHTTQSTGPDIAVFLYKPSPHSVFLTPPETKERQRTNNALAYGQRSVILPWSNRNQCEGDAGQKCEAWTLIEHMLREDKTSSSRQLCGLLQALMVHFPTASTSRIFSFQALASTLDTALAPEEQHHFYANVLPWMKRMVCAGPAVFGSKRISLLRQGVNERVVLRNDEVVILMCCAFFSLFPGRSSGSNTRTLDSHFERKRPPATGEASAKDRQHTTRGGGGGTFTSFGISTKLPPINFDSLFCATSSHGGGDAHCSKIRCLLQYFMTTYETVGDVTKQYAVEVSRVSYDRMPDFSRSQAPLQPVVMKRTGLLEDEAYALQVDFANKVIGGGVLGRGCVQEEIRFVVSPELLLSRLVCETLKDHEAVFISGSGQFSCYTGYASSFRFTRALDPATVKKPAAANSENVDAAAAMLTEALRTRPSTTRQPLPLRDVCVVAMDAVDYHSFRLHPEDQYATRWVTREMQKAFVSFYGTTKRLGTLPSIREGPIATGNWGCGAFGGDVELKLLVQWCAASEAARSISYYVFDRQTLPDDFASVRDKLLREQWTVGDVVGALERYQSARAFERERFHEEAADMGALASRGQPRGVFEYILSSTRQHY